MRRAAYLVLAILLGAGRAAAQGPGLSPVPRTRPQAPSGPESLAAFDPQQVELRWLNNGWELDVAGVRLKDFGNHQAEAWEALRLIRNLHLTQRGTIGTPQPIVEYWLSDGRAPQGFVAGLHMVPLDQATLQVQQIQGQWCVRDAQRVLFNFGPQQADAAQAVAVLRHYGFTQVGYVGWPNPLMMYFLAGGPTLAAPPHLTVPPLANGLTPPPTGPAKTGPLESRLLATSTHQLTPAAATTGQLVHFDPVHVDIRQDRDVWHLVTGPHVLATFASMQEARLAQGIVQSYHFTEQIFLTGPSPSFSYFLVHGQPPRELRFGVPSRPFRPDAVTVRQIGQNWMLCDGEQPLENFGDRQGQAQELVQVIQRYHFDHLCRIGPVGPLSMTYLVKSR